MSTAGKTANRLPDDMNASKPSLLTSLTLFTCLSTACGAAKVDFKSAYYTLGVSRTNPAIAWVLAWHGVTGAIVGARSPKQVDGWIGAPNVSLTEDDLAEIAAAVEQTGAGKGPAVPRRS